MSMNVVHFMGNLTRDPETKTLPSGKTLCKFAIAVNGMKKDDEPTYLECEAWDKTAELVSTYHQKGSPIIVHGRAKQDNWTDKESGKKRSRIIFVIDRIDFVPGGKRDKQESSTGGVGDQEAVAAGVNDSDIPFNWAIATISASIAAMIPLFA